MIFLRALRPVLVALVLFAAAGGLLIAYFYDHVVPFDLDKEPGRLTRFHLSTLEREPERCYAALERAGVDFRTVPPLEHERGCGYDDAVRLQSSGVSYGGSVTMRCPAMLGLLLWERHVLQSAAREHLGSEAQSVRHLGSYACRPIMRRENRALSQHAFANAIDIAAVTTGKQTVTVLRDWSDEGERGRFLRALRDGACRIFSATLSPDFDKAHANHFHFDMGRWRTCR